MVSVMSLNGDSRDEIYYGLLVFFVFFAVLLACDFIRYRSRWMKLKELKNSISVTLAGLPETADALEQGYQELLEILFSEKFAVINKADAKEQDMVEYFTMWVHQIKTPIAALKLLLQEKEQNGGGREEQQELFRIEQYVEMALQYMRLGSESTDFVLCRVKLDKVIKEAVHKYARQFIHKKICLKYESLDEEVLSDEKWLEFVIGQILSNAIKYTKQGCISIYIESGTGEGEGRRILVIEDTGIGIRAEDLPRICEKGYTGYNGHSDKRSTGIGLYLCSRILTKLGHSLAVTSEEGKGTQVRISFEGNRV